MNTNQNDDKKSRRVTENADDAPTSTTVLMDGDDKTTVTKGLSPNHNLTKSQSGNSTDRDISHAMSESVIDEKCDTQISEKCIENLCKGMVQNMIPDLEKAKVSVDEALRNQEVLIETVQQENTKFMDCTSMGYLVEMMHEAKSYYGKLLTAKKEMNMLSDKTQRLKRRAVKLQQQKQKEEQYLIQQRERELEKEQQLVARVAKKSEMPSNAQDSNTV